MAFVAVWKENSCARQIFLSFVVTPAPTRRPLGKAAKVSIATTRVWYDDDNAKVEKTDWVTVTILNEKAVAFALANVKKGDPVYAECRIADGSYEKDGQKIYTTDIIANTFDLLRPHDAD